MITAFHGLAAFRGERCPRGIAAKAQTAMTGVQLCTADRPIGPVGLVLAGDLDRVFNQDVWSVLDANGVREVSGWYYEDAVPETQGEYEAFCRNALAEKLADGFTLKSYCEAWVRPYALRAVWVKAYADPVMHKTAAILARHRGVPLIVVDQTTRIWEVLDNHNLPIAM